MFLNESLIWGRGCLSVGGQMRTVTHEERQQLAFSAAGGICCAWSDLEHAVVQATELLICPLLA